MSVPRPAVVVRHPLGELLSGLGVEVDPAAAAVAVSGLSLDSRAVRPGDLYAALPGARAHGVDFMDQAIAAGAVAVLTDPVGAERLRAHSGAFPIAVASQPRGVLGDIAARCYGTDTRAPHLVGITGTNGKTTTSYLLESALRALGHHTGLVGTVEIRVGDERLPSVRTTPEAPDLHALFAVMLEQAVDTCVMEVSSHALRQHRVDGVRFDLVLFTNLSQDHLDYHPDMADYFAAKASLFQPDRADQGLVCVDDDWGAELAARGGIPTTTLTSRADRQATWRVEVGRHDPLAFTLTGPGTALALRSALPGDFNVVNTAMAAVALLLLGVPADEAAAAVLTDPHVPGRMERVVVAGGDGLPLGVVDYAHTPDAVRVAGAALQRTTRGPLVLVLGAGGDRDRGKRAAMGAAAGAVADVVVITDDNPRSEDPAAIRAAVRAGAESAGHAYVVDVADRRRAIAVGVQEAAARGGHTACVAVVGKGHETGQEVAGVIHPFDDRLELRAALNALLADPKDQHS